MNKFALLGRVLAGLYTLYIFLFLGYLLRVFKKRDLYKTFPPHLHQPFLRHEHGNWPFLKILVGGAFKLPLRMLLITLLIYANLLLSLKNLTSKKSLAHRFLDFFIQQNFIFGRLLFENIWSHRHVRLSIQDFDSNYQGPVDFSDAPISISNHVSWIEAAWLIMFRLKTSILVNSFSILKNFPFKKLIDYLGYETFDIFNAWSRKASVQAIVHRALEFTPQSVPLHIFPEGTTTNGNSLLPFKHGAFQAMSPVKLYCFKYECDQFNPCFDILGVPDSFILSLCLRVRFTVFELSNINPRLLNFKSAEDFGEYCRRVMGKVLCVPLSEGSIRAKYNLFQKVRSETS